MYQVCVKLRLVCKGYFLPDVLPDMQADRIMFSFPSVSIHVHMYLPGLQLLTALAGYVIFVST